jgi:hypothetical protein
MLFEVREAHRVPRRFRRYNEGSLKRHEFTTGCDATGLPATMGST